MLNKLITVCMVLMFLSCGIAHAQERVYLKQVTYNSNDRWSSEMFSLVLDTRGKQIQIEQYELLKNIAERMNEENGFRIETEDLTGDGTSDYIIVMRIPRGPDFLHAVDGKTLKTIYSHGWNKKFVEPNMNMRINYSYQSREIVCEVVYADAPQEGKYDEYLNWKNAHRITYIWSEKKQKFVKIAYTNFHK